MQITVNNTVYEVPFSLNQIKLHQYLDYYEKYGKKINQRLDEINKTDYAALLAAKGFTDITEEDIELHKQIDINEQIDNEALAWYSFWTGCDFFNVNTQAFVVKPVHTETFFKELLNQYRVLQHLLYDVEDVVSNFYTDIEWNGELWHVQDFTKSKPGERCYNEIEIAREVYKHVFYLKKGKWNYLQYLCAVFIRKKGEEFDSTILNDRIELMKDLPMDIAMALYMLLKDAYTAAHKEEKLLQLKTV